MSDQSDLSEPLKTWSHPAGKRRRPSECEIVSTNLLWSADDAKGAARAFRASLGFTARGAAGPDGVIGGMTCATW